LERLRIREKFILDDGFEGKMPILRRGWTQDFLNNNSDDAESALSVFSRNSKMPLVHIDKYFCQN
jgi:hypothetical protein